MHHSRPGVLSPMCSALLLVGCVVPQALAATPRLVAVAPPEGQTTSSVGALSADGRVAGGTSGALLPMLWSSATGAYNLALLPGGDSAALYALSGDGSFVAGTANTPAGYRAARWHDGGTPEDLGVLPGDEYSFAQLISADGSIVIGASFLGGFGRSFRWQGGVMEFVAPPPGFAENRVSGMTPDAGVLVGLIVSPRGETLLYRWTQAEGFEYPGSLPESEAVGAATVSADGAVVVAAAYFNTDDPWNRYSVPFRWTAADGAQALGLLPDFTILVPTAANADGSVIVGAAGFSGFPPRLDGWVWTGQTGLVHIAQYAASLGVDVTGWRLGRVEGISADGSVLAGFGLLNGVARGWVLFLCGADFNGDGQVDFFDYLDFVAAFAADEPSADFNGDAQVDFFDYLDFVAAFAEGCE